MHMFTLVLFQRTLIIQYNEKCGGVRISQLQIVKIVKQGREGGTFFRFISLLYNDMCGGDSEWTHIEKWEFSDTS